MKSLRGRLLIWLIGLTTATSVFAGVAAYVMDLDEVNESLDGQLRQVAVNIGDTDFPVASREGDGVEIESEDRFVVTIWDASGRPHSSDPTFQVAKPAAVGYADFENGGREWRGYTQVLGARTILVAQRIVVRDEFAANSALRAILPVAVLIPLTWLLVGWVVGRVLRPLHGVTQQLRGWGKARTSPLALDGVPDEILPLGLATNELVTRLQSQLEFRERFISDAAHELRTPLAALRLQVGNLAESANSPEQRALLDEVTSGIRRMSEMVGKLLLLARADASIRANAPVAVDLSEAVTAALQDVIPLAVEKDIDIGVVETSHERILADPDELRTLIGNLAENAVRYTPRGGVIDVAVVRAAPGVVLEVRDTGPGIPEALIDGVFGRFVRLPGTGIEGSGLGLPIVKAIADRCGARVTLVNRKDRTGLIARVSFVPHDAATLGVVP